MLDSASLEVALSTLAEAQRQWEQANELMSQLVGDQLSAQDAGEDATRHAQALQLLTSTLLVRTTGLFELYQSGARKICLTK